MALYTMLTELNCCTVGYMTSNSMVQYCKQHAKARSFSQNISAPHARLHSCPAALPLVYLLEARVDAEHDEQQPTDELHGKCAGVRLCALHAAVQQAHG